ncbi:MAG: hypothetical protein KDC33_12265 [Thermoleophilia bacterium]|nr:hypothetical protein [Thermoleophilia bacterium]
MLAMGVYTAWRIPATRPGEPDPNRMDLDDSVVGVVGLWLLAAVAAFVVRRLAGRREPFWRVATSPALTATFMAVWLLVACGSVSARIT